MSALVLAMSADAETALAQVSTTQTPGTAALATQTPPPPEPTLLEADNIDRGETDDVIVATGNVTSRAQGRTIKADKLTYNQRTGIVTASGNVVIVNPDGTSNFAEQLTLDDELATGVVANFATRLEGGALLAASAAVRRKGVGNLLSNVVYTACPVCADGSSRPTWAIRARRANQDEKAESITYNDLIFEIKGVPVLYVPYFQHADPSVGRRTGFLQPKPGESSRYGWFLEQPYLYVIDPSSDFTLSPLVSQYVNPLIQGQYRRKFFSGDLILDGSFTYEKFFGKRGEKFGDLEWRSHLFSRARFDINKTWKWGFGTETASDDLYLFRYRLAPDGQPRGLIRPQSSRLISEVFVQGQGENFYVRSLAASFQDLVGAPGDPYARRKNVPKVLPLIDVNYRHNWGPMNGRFDFASSAVALNRTEDRQDSLRASLVGQWRGSKILPLGLVVEPLIYARTDYFNYSAATRFSTRGLPALASDSFARSVGLASVQASWPLVRPSNRFNITLEPKISATLATKAENQDRVRVEDSSGFELDATSVMRPVGAAAYDLWEGGNRASLGLSAGFDVVDDKKGQAPIRATMFLGRRLREASDDSFSRASNLDRKNSDWVSQFDVNFRTLASLGGRVRLDGDSGKMLHAEANARLKVWRTDTTIRYHDFNADAAGSARTNSEVQATTRFTINKNFKAFASVHRNLTDKVSLYEAFGITYSDDCTDFRLFSERIGTRNRFVEPSNSIRFQIAFKSLGVLSDEPFD